MGGRALQVVGVGRMHGRSAALEDAEQVRQVGDLAHVTIREGARPLDASEGGEEDVLELPQLVCSFL
jgi:hypothetical protein